MTSFRRLTFRHGNLGNARFAPDGRTIVYGARWSGETTGPEPRLYRTQVGSPESEQFDFPGDILAISPVERARDRAGTDADRRRNPFPRPDVRGHASRRAGVGGLRGR